MTIELNKYGFLQVGTQITTIQEIHDQFATQNSVRADIWKKFSLLYQDILSASAFQGVEFFGSFFSNKLHPADIDIALEFRPVESPFTGMEKFFNREILKHDWQTDLLIKELNSTPYEKLKPQGYTFTTNNLLLFRRIDRKQMKEVAKVDKIPPEMGREYKGVLRVNLP